MPPLVLIAILSSDNHLKLLARVGAGTIDPTKIEVRGLSVKEPLHPFNPQRQRVVHPLSYHCHSARQRA